MADFNCTDVTGIIRLMERVDIFDGETEAEILSAGAEDMIERINSNIARSKFRLDGYLQHIKPGEIKLDKEGEPCIYVTPSGKNAHGASRGAVLFVLNYGRQAKYGKIEGGYFWTKARAEAQKVFPQIVQKIAVEKLQERGLI